MTFGQQRSDTWREMLDSKQSGNYRPEAQEMTSPRRRGAVYMRLHKEGRKRLAKLLIIQEVTHRELAEACGWKSHGMVGHLLSGRRIGVEADAALIIAKKLGVELSDLFLTEVSSVARRATTRTRASAGSASLITVGGVLVIALEALLLVSLLGIGVR